MKRIKNDSVEVFHDMFLHGFCCNFYNLWWNGFLPQSSSFYMLQTIDSISGILERALSTCIFPSQFSLTPSLLSFHLDVLREFSHHICLYVSNLQPHNCSLNTAQTLVCFFSSTTPRSQSQGLGQIQMQIGWKLCSITHMLYLSLWGSVQFVLYDKFKNMSKNVERFCLCSTM